MKRKRAKAVLIIGAVSGGVYTAYSIYRHFRNKKIREMSERLRFGRQDIKLNDKERSEAYFAGYKNGLDDGYSEGFDRGVEYRENGQEETHEDDE
ncbi:MAG: hypothetical protein IK007_02205 [Lachnospiraceae bacterium]|nr:hypothetical protein [Lachnospiraceae bacterium]